MPPGWLVGISFALSRFHLCGNDQKHLLEFVHHLQYIECMGLKKHFCIGCWPKYCCFRAAAAALKFPVSDTFLRSPQSAEEDKARVCRYIEAFTMWDPATRVEQYALLHLAWELAAPGDARWRAVIERLEKALAPVQAPVPPPAPADAPLA